MILYSINKYQLRGGQNGWGAQFAKMLSDKHLLELNRMEYKYSTVSVKEFAELLRQNFAQPLPLTDFSGNKLFYLPNLAQISTNGIQKTE